MAPPVRFSTTLKAICPPWLQATISGPVMESLGDVFDTATDRMRNSVRLRWPANGADEKALAALSKDRKIRRGPQESAAVFATRLPSWLDDHRTRGNPYTLLLQMRRYFVGLLDVPIDLVYYNGRRFQMPIGATVPEDITRDDITWTADGSGDWSRIWIFFNVGTVASPGDNLLTEGGDQLTTEGGDTIVADRPLTPADVTGAPEEVFTAIVREWIPAHVSMVKLVFLFNDARLWSYPPPLGTWASPLPATRTTWGGTESPIIITIDMGA